MGASAREIEREIKETRDRMDKDLSRLEGRAAYNAVRFGRVAAVAGGVVAVAGVGFFIYRRTRKPRVHGRLDDLSMQNVREVTQRLKEQFPTLTVRVNEKSSHEPGLIESIGRKVIPALVSTAATAALARVMRKAEQRRGRATAPQAG